MAREITIEVTASDIANGKPGQPCDCPIYLAAKRAGIERLLVGSYVLGVYDEVGNRTPVRLPHEAMYFIALFDISRPVEPFAFTVELPGD